MRGKEHTISVITPFYRGNAFLGALFSNLEKAAKTFSEAHTDGGVDLILVNDSPEEQVILPEGEFCFTVRVLEMPENSGIHAARVQGLKSAEGEWILFLDQDDEILPVFLTRQIACGEETGMAVSNYFMEDENGNRTPGYRKQAEMQRLNDKTVYLYSHNVIKSPGQCLIRKSLIPEEWKDLTLRENGADDLFLWLLLLEQGKRFSLNETPLYVHRFTGQNLSGSVLKMGESTLKAAELLKKIPWFPEKDIRILENARLFDRKWQNGSASQKAGAVLRHPGIFARRTAMKIRLLFSRNITK